MTDKSSKAILDDSTRARRSFPLSTFQL